MKTLFLAIALPLAVSAGSGCKKGVRTAPVIEDTAPYPSLTEQRDALTAKPKVVPTRLLDSTQIINDLQYFASDACEGRKPGTAGHGRAMERIIDRMRLIGLDSFGNALTQSFSAKENTQGTNVIGWVKGTTYPDKYILLTAHYDHVGRAANDAIYYGADDNASGVACLLALAKYFKQNPHSYSLIFAALDKEESGLEGAYGLVRALEENGSLTKVKFNLNMDMIARSDNNEIFACGLKHYPSFRYAVDEVQNKTNVKLLMGHDGGTPGDDWTPQSDHYAFHKKRIPFLYIGVEDHPDYHKPTDTYDKINYSRYVENCNMVLLMVQALRP